MVRIVGAVFQVFCPKSGRGASICHESVKVVTICAIEAAAAEALPVL
jgi:hypothetical protein